MAGGRTSEAAVDILSSVETFDPSTGIFSISSEFSLRVPRSGHSTGFLSKSACQWNGGAKRMKQKSRRKNDKFIGNLLNGKRT